MFPPRTERESYRVFKLAKPGSEPAEKYFDLAYQMAVYVFGILQRAGPNLNPQTFQQSVLNTHGCICPTGGVHWVQSVHRARLDRSRSFRRPWSLGRIQQRLNPLHPVLLNPVPTEGSV